MIKIREINEDFSLIRFVSRGKEAGTFVAVLANPVGHSIAGIKHKTLVEDLRKIDEVCDEVEAAFLATQKEETQKEDKKKEDAGVKETNEKPAEEPKKETAPKATAPKENSTRKKKK